jgi:hypothetical protein
MHSDPSLQLARGGLLHEAADEVMMMQNMGAVLKSLA